MAISLNNVNSRLTTVESKISSGLSITSSYRNGNDWYIKYSNGFIIQSGYRSGGMYEGQVINFLTPMSTTTYAINLIPWTNANWDFNYKVQSLSTTSMTLGLRFGGTCRWVVYGYLVSIVILLVLGGVGYGNIS